MEKTPHLTAKQLDQLRVIVAGNDDSTHADLDQILDRLRYHTSKASFQFSLRTLVGRGLVEKLPLEYRRGAQRRPIRPTEAGVYAATRPVSVPDEQDNIVELGGEDFSADLEPVLESIMPDFL